MPSDEELRQMVLGIIDTTALWLIDEICEDVLNEDWPVGTGLLRGRNSSSDEDDSVSRRNTPRRLQVAYFRTSPEVFATD
jgi:hypothetical protein